MQRRQPIRLLIALSVLVPLGLPSPTPAAEEVTNVRITETGDKYLITYDLDSQVPGFVDLLGSADGGRTFDLVMEFVVGDVGDRVTPGKDRNILWDAERDLAGGLEDADIIVHPFFTFRKRTYREERQLEPVKTKAQYQADIQSEREEYTRWILDNETRLKDLLRERSNKIGRLSSLRLQTPLLSLSAMSDPRDRKKAEKAERKRAREIDDLEGDIESLDKDIDALRSKLSQLKAERRELD